MDSKMARSRLLCTLGRRGNPVGSPALSPNDEMFGRDNGRLSEVSRDDAEGQFYTLGLLEQLQ